MIDVIALGEVLIDFTDAGISDAGQKLFERNPGGAPANVLVALQRLGHQTAFLGKVGADMHGEFLRATMVSNNINVHGLLVDPRYFTTLAFVALDEQGDRSFSFARKPGADTQIAAEEVNTQLIEESKIFHIGSLSLTDEPARAATFAALETAKAAGCVMSYDPNYRANLWPSVSAAIEQMRAVLPYIDIMKMSDNECELLTDIADPAEAAKKIVSGKVDVCCVTLGSEGALVCTKDGVATVPPFKTEVVDTTGAGDAFWGGFLAAFLESSLTPADVTLEDAKKMARMGNAEASLCVRKRGGIPAMPERAKVLELLA
ncbi:carbohydrate kinase family protein [uncultured Olegusella sp.]|uniref:carbohydrate kinase family protein n=1 Tax=uncultured Olegusella sp. TaxID=1979846 RepID=UPI00261C1A8C|nr:carbohydrate kinase [uncultured Olegusella sp.]